MTGPQFQNLTDHEYTVSKFYILQGVHIQFQEYSKVREIASKVDWKRGSEVRQREIKKLIKQI